MMHKIALHVITCTTATVFPLCAATVESYTQPLGISVAQVPDGMVMLANPYLATAVYQATVSAANATSVTLSSPSVPDVLTHPHYLEIHSGALTGTTVSIIDATANSVTLEHPLSGLLAGDKVRIRPHFTLASTFAHTALTDDNFPEVTLYDEDWARSIYSYSTEHGWQDAHGGANNLILHPAEGLILDSGGLGAVVFIGEVSSSPIAVPMPTMTSTLLGTLNPATSLSLTHLGLTSAFKAGDSFGVYVPAGDGGLVADADFTFFANRGFFDSTYTNRNDYELEPLQSSIILRGRTPTTITLPAAYPPATP